MFKRPFLIIATATLLAACGGIPHEDTTPPEWVVGTYRYSGSGRVAKKFPWEAKGDLVLDQNGQYTLSVTVHIDDAKGGDTDTDESYGSYYVDGNRLVLHSVTDDDAEEFQIQDGKLIPRINWAARLALKGFRIPDPVFVKTE